MNIAIGDAATGIAAVLSEDGSTVQSVGLGNVNGVTLGYQSGTGQGEAKAEKRRQQLEDLGHRDRYRHGQPHAAGEQAVRD